MNMNYCKYENTVAAMQQCIDGLDDFDASEASPQEVAAYKRFIELCKQVARGCEQS